MGVLFMSLLSNITTGPFGDLAESSLSALGLKTGVITCDIFVFL